MYETAWMGLALERKDTLDKILNKVSDLIYKVQLREDVNLIDELGVIYSLANEDAKW